MRRRSVLFSVVRPWLCSLLLAGSVVTFSGCRKAAVDRYNPTITTTISASDPAVFVRSENDSQPWYRELQVVLEKQAADEKDLNAKIEQKRPEVTEASTKLLVELDRMIQAEKNANDKWSALTLTLGKGRKQGEILFSADVGLTRLYAKRPAIAFNDLPLELCVAKLARESGLHESQPRGYNPTVNWGKTDVSAAEAYEGVLRSHGFEHKFTDTLHRVALRLQDYSSRKEFLDAAVEQIKAKGKLLNSARPAVQVWPIEKAPQPEASDKKTAPAPAKRAD
ncbi:MAG TPA: hypothetical protein VEK08_26195 [Planctomycetota bacterium]|nr:hypothetical protein [Planctomycetota bacterium]